MNRIAVFSSNPGRAGGLVRKLRAAGHGVSWLFGAGGTQADKGPLGQELSGVEIHELPPKLTDAAFQAFYAKCRPRLTIIAGLSRILPKELIGIPDLGTINLHGGRVPQYRGGSQLNWQIINGEKEIGISILRVDEGIDTGPVLAQAKFAIADSDDIAFAHARAYDLFGDLAVDVVGALEAGRAAETAQDETQAAYWHQRSDADGAIRWNEMTARQVHDLVRALSPLYPAAHCAGPSGTVRFSKTELPDLVLRGVPGRVVFLQKRGPYVICLDRAILALKYETSDGGLLRHGSCFT